MKNKFDIIGEWITQKTRRLTLITKDDHNWYSIEYETGNGRDRSTETITVNYSRSNFIYIGCMNPDFEGHLEVLSPDKFRFQEDIFIRTGI